PRQRLERAKDAPAVDFVEDDDRDPAVADDRAPSLDQLVVAVSLPERRGDDALRRPEYRLEPGLIADRRARGDVLLPLGWQEAHERPHGHDNVHPPAAELADDAPDRGRVGVREPL